MKYPQSELLDPKSKGEIIEQAADLVVNSVNLLVTAIVLYVVYDIYESEKAEKEEKQKVQNRETIQKLNGTSKLTLRNDPYFGAFRIMCCRKFNH